MKQKCGNCVKFNKVGTNALGRQSGYCHHFKGQNLPYFIPSVRTLENKGETCAAFESKFVHKVNLLSRNQ